MHAITFTEFCFSGDLDLVLHIRFDRRFIAIIHDIGDVPNAVKL